MTPPITVIVSNNWLCAGYMAGLFGQRWFTFEGSGASVPEKDAYKEGYDHGVADSKSATLQQIRDSLLLNMYNFRQRSVEADTFIRVFGPHPKGIEQPCDRGM